MKHFLISNDIGNPIYFDHPDGRMLCLPVVLFQDVLSANFKENFTVTNCGNTLVVFQRFEQLSFTVMSNQGESENFLRSQLRLVHELLLMVFGPVVLHGRKQINFQKSKMYLQRLIDTMCWLSQTQQSFLVESIEILEVNDSIRNQCLESLKKSVDSIPQAVHGLLFAGSKVLASYTKPKVTELSSMDLFLLVIYITGTFSPHVNFMQETTLPIADYTDHDQVMKRRNEGAVQNAEPLEDSFVEEGKLETEDVQFLFLDPEVSTLFDEVLKAIEEETGNMRSLLEHLIMDALSILSDGTMIDGIARVRQFHNLVYQGVHRSGPLEEIKFLQLLLNRGKFGSLKLDGVYGEFTDQAIQKFCQTCSLVESKGNQSMGVESSVMVYLIKEIAQTFAEVSSPHHLAELQKQASAKRQSIPPEVKAEPPKREKHPQPKFVEDATLRKSTSPIYAQLYLRTPSYNPYWVYSVELNESVSLVIVNKDMKGTKEEEEKLFIAQASLKQTLKNYFDYFSIRQETHLSVLSYLHQLPGLVHFIFVDRITNRVVAPTIAPLHGQQCAPHDDSGQQMVKLLKEKVWDMCYLAQNRLAEGYSSMLVKSGEFQYSYHLWLEDNEGYEVAIESPFTHNARSMRSTFYKDLTKRTPRATKCYELYTLYLGLVAVSTIAKHERTLIQMLKGQ